MEYGVWSMGCTLPLYLKFLIFNFLFLFLPVT